MTTGLAMVTHTQGVGSPAHKLSGAPGRRCFAVARPGWLCCHQEPWSRSVGIHRQTRGIVAELWGRLVSMCGAAVCLLSHVSTGNIYGRFIIILIFAKGLIMVPACGRDNQVNPGTIPVPVLTHPDRQPAWHPAQQAFRC